MKSEVYNTDCLEAMRLMKDNQFDLAIVDPPYGINQTAFRISTPKGAAAKTKKYNNKVFKQKTPDTDYFINLFRVSKNQVIWGANYFNLKLEEGKQWLFWDKDTQAKYGDGELAYTSFIGAIKKFKHTWHGMIQEDMKNKEKRIHPTQKPVALYKWLLKNYAKEGDTILDTHLGSGSSRIACHEMNYDFTGYEIDKDYFDASDKRFKLATSQQNLFEANEMY